jgi:hypothetical protein
LTRHKRHSGAKRKTGLAIHVSIVISFLLYFPRERKLAEFQEPFKYVTLAVDEVNIYVVDKKECIVHIYSRNDFHHVGQFGRIGQGPEDFEFIGFLRVFPDYLFISSGRKVSYFSKKGDFLRTVTPPYPATGSYIPLGSNFAGQRYLPEDPKETQSQIMVELFDAKFKKMKDLYLAGLSKIESYDFESGKKNLLVIGDCFKLEVYKERLYVGNTATGFFVRVFDAQGIKLYDINLPYDKRNVSPQDQKAILDSLRRIVGEQRFNRGNVQFRYVFPKFYPAFTDFAIADENIYVFLYRIPGKSQEVLKLDLRGNLIKKITIPGAQPIFTNELPYCIYRGDFYYMIYNEETNRWELHLEHLG